MIDHEFSYVVEGRPVTWQRDNVVMAKVGSGKATRLRYISDAKTKAGERAHRLPATLALTEALGRPVTFRDMDGEFYVGVIGFWPDGRHGDCDRLLTLVMDALQGVAYHEDRQVKMTACTVLTDKARPRVEVFVRRIG